MLGLLTWFHYWMSHSISTVDPRTVLTPRQLDVTFQIPFALYCIAQHVESLGLLVHASTQCVRANSHDCTVVHDILLCKWAVPPAEQHVLRVSPVFPMHRHTSLQNCVQH